MSCIFLFLPSLPKKKSNANLAESREGRWLDPATNMPVLFPTDTFLPVWQQRVECEDELTRQARLRAAMQRNAVGILERAASANVRSAEAAITRYFGSREKKNAEDWNEWGRIQDQCALVVADIGHFELVTQVPLVPSFVLRW